MPPHGFLPVPLPYRCSPDPVFSDTLLEHFIFLVESTEQCFILTAQSLIGFAYHFCRYIRFTVGYTLVMLDDLSLDVVKHKIGFPRFHTLALCLVPFGIPKLFRDSPLAAELCYRSVDCNPSHDGDNSVLFLTAVHVEQQLECASCHTRFFFGCKTINQRVTAKLRRTPQNETETVKSALSSGILL